MWLGHLGLFFSVVFVQAQVCNVGNLTWDDLTAFQQCTTIRGNVIMGVNATSFDMPSLLLIDGSFLVEHSPRLANFSLPNLITINGDFRIVNAPLTELDLSSLATITGGEFVIQSVALSDISLPALGSINNKKFSIQSCPLMTSLSLPLLRTAIGSFSISGNPQLGSIAAVGPLTTLSGLFSISMNGRLGSLTGPLDNLTVTSSQISIYGNNNITSLLGLHNLNRVTGLQIEGNTHLTDLLALANLRTVDGTLRIANNALITVLDGIYSLTSANVVTIVNMGALTKIQTFPALQCAGFSVLYCFSVTSITGGPYFPNNNSSALLVIQCPMLRDLVGFSSNYISTLHILDCGALVNVSGIAPQFSDRVQVSDNDMMTNVDFLRNIRDVIAINVFGNALTDLSGFALLRTVKTVFLLSNDQTVSYAGVFPSLTSVQSLSLRKNTLLQNLNGFETLADLDALKVEFSPALVDISGLTNVNIKNTIHFYVCDKLPAVDGLGLPSVLQTVIIDTCPMVSSIGALTNLKQINNGSLILRDLPLLPDLNQLKNLTAVHGTLRLATLLNLTSVDGLSNLKQFDNLEIINNFALKTLKGLCGTQKGGGFYIDNNPLLCCSAVIETLSLPIHNKINSPSWFVGGCQDVCTTENNVACSCAPGGRCGTGLCSEFPGPTFDCFCSQFYEGALCQYLIPNIDYALPDTVDFEGGANITVVGQRFPDYIDTNIGGIKCKKGSNFTQPSQYFTIAPNISRVGYQNLTAVNTYEPHEWATPKVVVYFADFEACGNGSLLVGGLCTSCPEGAVCPGGPRMWPVPGYWSNNELEVPSRCRVPGSCPGTRRYPPQLHPNGEHVTNNCGLGYDGVACGGCTREYALDSFGNCLSCGLTADEKFGITSVVICAIVLAAILATSVALFDEERLALAATGLMGFQRALATGQICASHYGSALLSDLFSQLSFFNFDVQFVKPGCTVSRIYFDDVFWGTVGVCCMAALLFIAAAAARAYFMSEKAMIKHRKEEEEQDLAFEREINPDFVGFDTQLDLTPDRKSGASTPGLGGTPHLSPRASISDHQPPKLRPSVIQEEKEDRTYGSVEMSSREVVIEEKEQQQQQAEKHQEETKMPALRRRSSVENREASAQQRHSSAGIALVELSRREGGEVVVDTDDNEVVDIDNNNEGGPPPPPPPPPALGSPSNSSLLKPTTTLGASAKQRRKHKYTRTALFKRRAVHSLIILGSIIHFQLCLKCLQGLVCDKTGNGQYFLRAELQTLCFHNPHVGTMVFIIFLLLGFCIGFPVWCGYQLRKVAGGNKVAGGDNELKNRAKIQRFGFLYRDLKPEYYWFRHSTFLVNFFLALFAVAIFIGPSQTFWTSLVMLFYTLAIVFLLPFEKWKNCVPLIMSLLSLIQFTVVLAIDATSTKFTSSYLFGFLLISLVSCVAGFLFRQHRDYFKRKFEEAVVKFSRGGR